MSPTPHSWRQHILSNMVFILAFLNYSLLLLFFFPEYMPKYYFPNYWPLLLVTCNSSSPVQVGAVSWNQRLKCEGLFAQETHGLEGATAPGLLQKQTVRAAAQTKGAEIKGRGRQTKSWSCYFPGIVQKSWVSSPGSPLTNSHFLPPTQKKVLWGIHHLAHSYSFCRTCHLNKGQLLGICEKCDQAPSENAVWNHVDASSSRHSIFWDICDF